MCYCNYFHLTRDENNSRQPAKIRAYSLLGRLLYCMNCHLAGQQLRMLRKLIICHVCKKAESAIICRAT